MGWTQTRHACVGAGWPYRSHSHSLQVVLAQHKPTMSEAPAAGVSTSADRSKNSCHRTYCHNMLGKGMAHAGQEANIQGTYGACRKGKGTGCMIRLHAVT